LDFLFFYSVWGFHSLPFVVQLKQLSLLALRDDDFFEIEDIEVEENVYEKTSKFTKGMGDAPQNEKKSVKK
jgi:hypothetical protein